MINANLNKNIIFIDLPMATDIPSKDHQVMKNLLRHDGVSFPVQHSQPIHNHYTCK